MTPTNTCLDAETLAAWVDGGLDPAAAAMAEAHVSSCDRCQAILGVMAKTEPVPVPSEALWWRRFRAAWVIPLTAGVAAVGLWMIVPTERQASTPSPLPPASSVASESKREAEAPAAAHDQAPAAARDQLATRFDDAADKNKEAKQAGRMREEDRVAPAREMMARPASPPPPAAAAPAAAQAKTQGLARSNDASTEQVSNEIASPDSRTRWRLRGGGSVEYTADGGTTWEGTQTGVTDQLVAGSSPTADVCWIVGKNGTVLLTTNGRQWQRVAFPETMDLSRVQASDSRSALVIAADGMLFRTLDAGATWTRP